MSVQPSHSTSEPQAAQAAYTAPAAVALRSAAPGAAAPNTGKTVHCFSIQAAAEPGVMPRVLELFAKRNLVPARWHSDVTGKGGCDLSIDLQVAGLDNPKADYIAQCLRQIYGVETVLTSEKRAFGAGG